MKKQENSKYLLGAALIGVWGLLGYRIYQKFSPEEMVYHRPSDPIENLQVEAPEPYALLVNYRDPFLEGKVPKVNPAKPKAPTTPPKRPAPPPVKKAVIFPEIEYKGNLKTKDGKTIAVVRVNQSVLNWQIGQVYEQLELKKVYEDSIRVAYSGEEKLIEKVR